MQPSRPGRWCEHHQRWECTRPRSRGRGTCHGPAVTDLDRCRMHLGEEAGPAIAVAALEQQARRLLYKHAATPVTDPLEALQRLAGRALALEETIGDLVNKLTSIRYESGGESSSGELPPPGPVLERALDRGGRAPV